ncbi:hypothetical protein HAL_23050 [Haladaptatus sp. T7]|nr:hypothetical protein HAL_23050 [Haladaptatus sp. T7]
MRSQTRPLPVFGATAASFLSFRSDIAIPGRSGPRWFPLGLIPFTNKTYPSVSARYVCFIRSPYDRDVTPLPREVYRTVSRNPAPRAVMC